MYTYRIWKRRRKLGPGQSLVADYNPFIAVGRSILVIAAIVSHNDTNLVHALIQLCVDSNICGSIR